MENTKEGIRRLRKRDRGYNGFSCEKPYEVVKPYNSGLNNEALTKIREILTEMPIEKYINNRVLVVKKSLIDFKELWEDIGVKYSKKGVCSLTNPKANLPYIFLIDSDVWQEITSLEQKASA